VTELPAMVKPVQVGKSSLDLPSLLIRLGIQEHQTIQGTPWFLDSQ